MCWWVGCLICLGLSLQAAAKNITTPTRLYTIECNVHISSRIPYDIFVATPHGVSCCGCSLLFFDKINPRNSSSSLEISFYRGEWCNPPYWRRIQTMHARPPSKQLVQWCNFVDGSVERAQRHSSSLLFVNSTVKSLKRLFVFLQLLKCFKASGKIRCTSSCMLSIVRDAGITVGQERSKKVEGNENLYENKQIITKMFVSVQLQCWPQIK